MNDNNDRSFLSNVFKAGTPECAVFSGAAAMVLGLLVLTVGFWNTVWIALFGVVGGVLGGVRDKKQMLKNVLNRIIPDKKTVPYREQHPDITQAVRDAAAKGYKTSGGDKEESEQD